MTTIPPNPLKPRWMALSLETRRHIIQQQVRDMHAARDRGEIKTSAGLHLWMWNYLDKAITDAEGCPGHVASATDRKVC